MKKRKHESETSPKSLSKSRVWFYGIIFDRATKTKGKRKKLGSFEIFPRARWEEKKKRTTWAIPPRYRFISLRRSLSTVFVRTRSWESLGKARALGRREGLSNRPVASFTVKSPLSSLCARHGDRETRARNTTEDNPAAILCRLLLGPLERFSGRVERTNSKRTNWWADLEIRLENPNVLG